MIDPNLELIGTWKTIPNGNRFDPIYKVVISNDSIFVSRREYGGSGYNQLLEYKEKDYILFATEIEYMSFDLNVGSVTQHFKYREMAVQLVLEASNHKSKLILYPLRPGTVLQKESSNANINVNFNEDLSKWRLSPHFKCDYKKNGRPITSATRKQGLRP